MTSKKYYFCSSKKLSTAHLSTHEECCISDVSIQIVEPIQFVDSIQLDDSIQYERRSVKGLRHIFAKANWIVELKRVVELKWRT